MTLVVYVYESDCIKGKLLLDCYTSYMNILCIDK